VHICVDGGPRIWCKYVKIKMVEVVLPWWLRRFDDASLLLLFMVVLLVQASCKHGGHGGAIVEMVQV